MIRLKY